MYGAHVLRHDLAGVAVAARRRPHQHTVLVQEAYGEPVQLRLRRVMHRRHLQSLACASIALARDSIGSSWRISPKAASDALPTRCVGESGVTSAGYCASMS